MTFAKMRKQSEAGIEKKTRLPLEFRGVTKLPQGQVAGQQVLLLLLLLLLLLCSNPLAVRQKACSMTAPQAHTCQVVD